MQNSKYTPTSLLSHANLRRTPHEAQGQSQTRPTRWNGTLRNEHQKPSWNPDARNPQTRQRNWQKLRPRHATLANRHSRSTHPRQHDRRTRKTHRTADGQHGSRHRFMGCWRPNLHEPVRKNTPRMAENPRMEPTRRRIHETHSIRFNRMSRMAQQNRHRPTIHRHLPRNRSRRTRPTQISPESRKLGTPKHWQTQPKPQQTSHPTCTRNPEDKHKTRKMGRIRRHLRTHQRSRAETLKQKPRILGQTTLFLSFSPSQPQKIFNVLCNISHQTTLLLHP